MKIVAITGGIATGKSTVAKFVKEMGYHVIDADKVGHEILKKDDVKELLIKEFGISLNEKNEIDRKTLGKIVFSDRKKLELLNSIIHPRIVSEILKKISQLSKKGVREVFVEAAVLFEMKFDRYVDYVIVTDCSNELRISRLMKRNHISREEAIARLKAQLKREEFLKRANYVINTSKSLKHTFNQVSDLLNLKPWSDKI
ncbi:dephospho-CoA kinase [Mesoaciditoga sp.]